MEKSWTNQQRSRSTVPITQQQQPLIQINKFFKKTCDDILFDFTTRP